MPDVKHVKVRMATVTHVHIFDGEEVITGGENGQVWIATFADERLAKGFVRAAADYADREIWGVEAVP